MILPKMSVKMNVCLKGGCCLRDKKHMIWVFIFVLFLTVLQSFQETKANGSTIIINSNQTNVREGPGLSYSKIGQVNQGEQFTVIKTNGDWIQIELDNKQKGWVANWLVTYSEKKSSTTEKLQKGTIISITTDGLRVRSGPGTSYQIIGSLNMGDSGEITDINGDWLKISFSGNSGWINSEFVKVTGQGNTSDKEKQPSSKKEALTGTVTASTLYVRDEGSLNGSIIAQVYKGEQFPILTEVNNWMKIEYKSGKYGWAASWFIQKSEAAPADSEIKNGSIEILYNGTNIRKKPSAQSEVVQRANKGETFEAVKLTNDWYEIRLKSGDLAYVAGWVVNASNLGQQVEKPGSEIHLKNKTIVIDPGHGGKDNGTSGFRGTAEKNITIKTALLLRNKLKAAGANVILTRTNDTFQSLNSRVRMSHYYGADAFISIHYDSISEKNVRGTTSFYYHSYQKALASSLHSGIVQYTNLKDRGVRHGDYHVLRENKQSAVLLELGYLSNPTEESLIQTDQFQEQAANGIFQGLAKYFKK